MSPKIEILPDKAALIARSQSLILAKMQEAIAQRGRCTLALAGGGTPKPIYEALSTADLPWEQVHFFWGDERYVVPTHPDSNQRMAKEAWLDRISIPVANLHPMPIQGDNPAQDAQTHDDELRAFFGVTAPDIPRLDIILLGMGDDGHTASLFPLTAALTVGDRLITVGNKGDDPRLTFTVPFINQARCVIFIVAGENKRPALAAVFNPEGDSHQYPSRLIQPHGELWWLLDEAAGCELATNLKSL
jgi:6-phosphogluconolactonase